MLRKIIEDNLFSFEKEATDWKDAIRKACIPLIRENCITERYSEEIIECINKYGPYIVIAPLVAIPHSTISQEGVNKCSISLTKFEKVVSFDENDREKDALIFFTLAANNPDDHLKNMQIFVEILENEDLMESLLKINSKEELIALSNKFNV